MRAIWTHMEDMSGTNTDWWEHFEFIYVSKVPFYQSMIERQVST